MEQTIKEILQRSASIKQAMAADANIVAAIQKLAEKALLTDKQGGTIYVCGNGGSGCDAMHLVEELVARYKRERRGIKGMHLLDPSIMSCWANDYDYKSLFARQVTTFCSEKDLLIGISTSGNSANVLAAFEAARKTKTFSVGLAGKDGGKLKSCCDLPIIVPAQETERIQEAHITIVHILCELMDRIIAAENA